GFLSRGAARPRTRRLDPQRRSIAPVGPISGWGTAVASLLREGGRLMVSGGRIEGKRVAILATDGVEQVELTSPMKALQRVGIEVHVIAPKGPTIRAWKFTEWGDKIQVDRTL